MQNINMTPEYKTAIDSIIKNPVTFLSGSAGTGKSTFIKFVLSKIKKTIVLAPTGVAAVNIGGSTIHSAFRFPPHFLLKGDIKNLKSDTAEYFRVADLIIIDEISMVSSNLLDAINQCLQNSLYSRKPFGGKRILLVGDLFQLSPIVSDPNMYSKFYDCQYFFGSNIIKDCMKNGQFKFVELKQVFRQKNEEFATVLNNIRIGKDVKTSIEYINSKCSYSNESPDDYVQITPYNYVSHETNQRKLAKIKLNPYTYYGKLEGNFKENSVPVEQAITLKVGARVMICKNDSENNVVNGTIGIISGMYANGVDVLLSDGRVVPVDNTVWENFKHEIDKGGELVTNSVGRYIQLPIKLAWSLTIHKVQSATIEKLYIDMGKGAFASGMLYVALSRATDVNKIILSKPIDEKDLIVDDVVTNFYLTHGA